MQPNAARTSHRVTTENVPLIMLAFACDPTQGSEPGAGWVALEAASELFSRIVVVTRRDQHTELENRVRSLPAHITVVRLDTPLDRRGPVYVRYLIWSIRAANYVTRHLKSDLRSATVHHVTYASDWMYSPVSFIRRQNLRNSWVVWGPVGGGTYAPSAVVALFPRKFRLKEIVRRTTTTALRKWTIRGHRQRVDVAVALNEDSARLMGGFRSLLVSPNIVLDHQSLPTPAKSRENVAIFAGRPLEWKGVRLAFEAQRAAARPWRLELYGGSPADFEEFGYVESPHVQVVGRVSRDELLQRLSEVKALILPSVHDSAPWIAAEAASLGARVICLDLGGVAMMAGDRAVVVSTSPATSLVGRLSEAVADALRDNEDDPSRKPSHAWTKHDLVDRMREWYELPS